MKAYNSTTDYPIILQAARDHGSVSLSIVVKALRERDITFPFDFNANRTPEAVAIDRDCLRAWEELGYIKPPLVQD